MSGAPPQFDAKHFLDVSYFEAAGEFVDDDDITSRWMDPAPRGFLDGLPRDTYDLIPRDNASSLVKALVSAKHYKHYMETRDEDDETKAKQVGTLAHRCLLEPHIDLDAELRTSLLQPGTSELVVYEGGRRYGRKWDDFLADNAGATIIIPSELESARESIATARKIRDAVLNDKYAASLLDGCRFELTGLCSFYDVPMKFRLDAARPGYITDLKTSRNIAQWAFGAQQANLDTEIRLAVYQQGVHQITGDVCDVYLIAVENVEPFDVVVYQVEQDALDQGWGEHPRQTKPSANKALKRIKKAAALNAYPGLAAAQDPDGEDEPGVRYLPFPDWKKDDASWQAEVICE